MFRIHKKRTWMKWLRVFNAVVILSLALQPVSPVVLLAQSASDPIEVEESAPEEEPAEEEESATEEETETAAEDDESSSEPTEEEVPEEDTVESEVTDTEESDNEASPQSSEAGEASSENTEAEDSSEEEVPAEEGAGEKADDAPEAEEEAEEDNPNIPNEPTVEADGEASTEKEPLEEDATEGESEEEAEKKEDVALAEWLADSQDDGYEIVEVAEGETYEYGDDGFSITFTQIDGDVADAYRVIGIKEVTLSDEQREALGALSDTAYDVISPMENGDFKYELTLPTPDDVDGDSVEVVYAENEGDLDDPDKIEVVDDEDISVDTDKQETKVKDLDHFTIFITTSGTELSVDGMVGGSSQVTASPGETVHVSVRVGLRWGDTWKSTQYKIEGENWQCINTPNHADTVLGTAYFTEEFDVQAPHIPGTYDVELRAYKGEGCSGNKGYKKLHDAITVAVENPPLEDTCGFDIALVVDNSGSINPGELSQMKSAMKGFVNALDGTPTQFSVTKFSTTASVVQSFTANTATVNSAIDSIGTTDRATNWEDGLVKARSTFDPRPSKPDLVIFASDGNPNRKDNGTSASESEAVSEAVGVANQIKGSDNTRILALGIGNNLDVDNLRAVSGPVVDAADIADSDVVTSDFNELASDLADFAEATCGGTITVNKYLENENTRAGTGWDFMVAGQSVSTDANGQTEAVDVDPGTYSVTETGMLPGYSFESAVCYENGDQVGSPITNGVGGITVGSSDIISCDFINTRDRTDVAISKDDSVDPVNNGDTLTYTLTITNESGVAASNVVVTDMLPSGFTPSSIVPSVGACSDTTAPDISCELGTLAGSATETVTITGTVSTDATSITNTASVSTDTPETTTGNNTASEDTGVRQYGTLIVKKVVLNNNGGTLSASHFTFSVNGGPATAFEVDGQNELSVVPGVYSVTETAPSGYMESYDNCSQVSIAAGETETCTITNDDRPAMLTACKYNDLNGNGVLDYGENMIPGWNMTLRDVTGAATSELTDQQGCARFESLSAGTYEISEENQSGWTPTGLVTQSVTLTNGQDAAVYFGNQQLGTIIVHKDVTGPNGEDINDTTHDFTYSVTGSDYSDGDTITDGETDTYNGLVAGTYTVEENGIPNGYELVSITDGGQAEVVPGQTTNVYIVNRQQSATLVLEKILPNDDGGTATPGDFPVFIDGQASTWGSHTVNAGTYSVSETTKNGYTASAWGTDCAGDGTVTLLPGETKTCSIENDDQPATLIVKKHVINDDFGQKDASAFTMNVTGTNASQTSFAGSEEGTTVTLDAGSYSVDELPDPEYAKSLSGDCSGTIGVGETKTCTVTNDDKDPVTILASKIVCDGEEDLPNGISNAGGEPVDADTATDYVAGSEGRCQLVRDWDFQWRGQGGPNPGNDTIGEVGGWNTFSGSATVPINASTNGRIEMREVLPDDSYLPFSGGSNVSAEFYCGTDAANYDNWEWLNNPTPGATYYCVAWNTKKTSDVEICKTDTFENPVPGWDIQLLGEKEEDVTVPTDGATVSTSDLPTGDYALVASGTYEYRGNSGLLTDPNFSQRKESDGYFGPYFPWINVNDLGTPGALGIMVDGVATNWSDYLASDNRYALGYSDHSGSFDFDIYDNNYSDNVGTMNVAVYHGYAGTTGDDGCVIFEDVPYGDYEIAETLRVGWENVDGLGAVLVDSDDETFSVINRQLPGTIEVTKVALDRHGNEITDTTTEFTIRIDGEDKVVKDGETVLYENLLPGVYTVEEVNVPGAYELISIETDEMPETDGTQVILGSNETVSVTVTNHEAPYCGDGVMDTDLDEQCDGSDGVTAGENFCTPTCQLIPIYDGEHACPTDKPFEKFIGSYDIGSEDADGEEVSLTGGVPYLFRAGDTYEYANNSSRQADVAYATTNNWSSVRGDIGIWGTNRGVTSVLADLGLGVGVVEWDDDSSFDADHTYEKQFTPDADMDARFLVSDWYGDWYGNYCKDQSCMGDNDGSITLDVYECSAPVTISASKIVCDSEEDLPNRHQGPDITATTAEDYVAASEGRCRLVSDWEFEWGNDSVSNPGDDFVGRAGNGWTTFGPTDGTGVTEVDVYDFSENRIKVREVLKEGYLLFSYLTNGGTNVDDVTAEFYCNTDVVNYDNEEWLNNPVRGETYHCVAWNVELGSIHGQKWYDENSDGIKDEGEAYMDGWTIFLDEDGDETLDEGEISMETSSDPEHFGWYWFEDLLPGEYSVCEVVSNGWEQTYPGTSSEPACHTVTVPDDNPNGFREVENYVPEPTPTYDFGNNDLGVLSIEKANDAGGDEKLSGEDVTYTIIVTALEGRVKGVSLSDLPPEVTTYVGGSWSASSSLGGAHVGNLKLDKVYASPGIWDLGDLEEGEVVTLTYDATVNDDVDPGDYPDLAFARGLGRGGIILAEAGTNGNVGDDNYVGTSITVKDDSEPETVDVDVDVEEEEEEEGEVLGESAELPATGMPTLWIMLSAMLIGLGALLLGGGIIARNGKLSKVTAMTKKFFSLMIALALGVGLLFGAAPAAEALIASQPANIFVRMEEPKADWNEDSFLLDYVVLDTVAEEEIDVECQMSTDGVTFTTFETDTVAIGGDSGQCTVDSTQLSQDDVYSFQVYAWTSTDNATSASYDVAYDSTRPGKPDYIEKDREGDCRNKVKLRTADDGQTESIKIYRDDDTEFDADADHLIKTVSIGPDKKYDFIDHLPNKFCGETVYYAVRAFDDAGNASDVRAEDAVKTIRVSTSRTETATTTETVTLTPGEEAAGETDAATEEGAEDEATEGEVAGEEAGPEGEVEGVTTESRSYWWLFWLLLAIAAGYAAYRRFMGRGQVNQSQ